MDFLESSACGKSLRRGARATIEDVLAVRKDERFLIITNPDRDVRDISMALYDAAIEVGARPTLIFQQAKGEFDFAEEEVIKAVSAVPDVLASISRNRLGKDRFGLRNGYEGKRRYDHIFDYLYEERKLRAIWSPGITTDMFSRTVPIDYTQLRKDAKLLVKLLAESESVRVTAPGGTDVTIGVKGRRARPDDGDFRKAGVGGNLPSGEVYVSPELGTSHGTIAFDGSMVLHEGEVVIREPIVAEIEKGFVRAISGGREAELLERTIAMGEQKARRLARKGDIKPSLGQKYIENARNLGELGIGLNRRAKIVANMLEDEKVYGTCHFAIGANYDGDAEALIHLDGLVKRPTITFITRSGKQKTVMTDGKLYTD